MQGRQRKQCISQKWKEATASDKRQFVYLEKDAPSIFKSKDQIDTTMLDDALKQELAFSPLRRPKCTGFVSTDNEEDVTYEVGIFRLKLFLTTAVLKPAAFKKMKNNKTLRVTAYVDDKINFWVTKIENDKPVGTSLIELILLPDGIASLKKVQHDIYDVARESPCLARIIAQTANAYDQQKQRRIKLAKELQKNAEEERLQKVKKLLTRKSYLLAKEKLLARKRETEESLKEDQERRKNSPSLSKLRGIGGICKLYSKHKTPNVSPPMTPRRLSPAPGSRKCDSPVLVRLLEEIEDAKRRS